MTKVAGIGVGAMAATKENSGEAVKGILKERVDRKDDRSEADLQGKPVQPCR